MRILCMLPASKGAHYPAEAERRRIDLLHSYASASTEIDVEYMPGVSGFSPWGRTDDPIGRDAAAIDEAGELGAALARDAEARGYDAFCPFGTLDLGVTQARAAGVTIPVVGQAEASILYCGLLGRRFASCLYISNPPNDELFRRKVDALGYLDLYVGSTEIGMANSEYPKHHDEVLARYLRCADEARQRGAEVMGIVAMSICPVEFRAKELSDRGGLPVIDAVAAQIAMAEWWHRLGLPPSLLRSERPRPSVR